MATFPPSVFAAVIGADLIVFDSAADRYHALIGAVCATRSNGTDVGWDGPGLVPEAAAALGEVGLLHFEAPSPVPVLRHPTTAHRPNANAESLHLLDAARFGYALLNTWLRLRKGRSCTTFTRSRHGADGLPSADLVVVLARLRAIRLVLPSPRRCLPASMIASCFLRTHGFDSDIVFGVRSHPFAAHCWIEAGGVVLDDDLDRVRAYTPIAVGRL